MKRLLAAVALAAAASMPAHAVLYGFSDEFSGGADCAVASTGCALLEVTAITGGVHYKLRGTMLGTEFITGFYGNIGNGAFVTPTVVGPTGTGLNAFDGISFSQDAFKADGDGYFDFLVDLSSNPPRFDGIDVLEWDFMGITLAQATGGISVNGGDPLKNGFTFGLHAQGLAEGSGWFNDNPNCPDCVINPVITVSEPSTAWLFPLALFGLWAGGRKPRFT